MRTILFFLLYIFITQPQDLKAQTIEFCTDYSSTGEALDPSTSWVCHNNISCKIYCLISSYHFNTDIIKYVIYKYSYTKKKYKYYETRYAYFYGGYDNWCVASLPIYTSGDYKVSAYDGEGEYLSSGYLTVSFY